MGQTLVAKVAVSRTGRVILVEMPPEIDDLFDGDLADDNHVDYSMVPEKPGLYRCELTVNAKGSIEEGDLDWAYVIESATLI